MLLYRFQLNSWPFLWLGLVCGEQTSTTRGNVAASRVLADENF